MGIVQKSDKNALQKNGKPTARSYIDKKSPHYSQAIFDWWRSLGGPSGSLTADTYLRKLITLKKEKGISPDDLLKLNPKKAHSLLCRLRDEDLERGLSPSTIEGYIKVYKSFLAFHDIMITKQIKIPYASATPTLRDEVIPTHNELNHIIMLSNVRDSTSILLMAQSGLRISVIGRGHDGLRVKDFPEMSITDDGKVEFQQTPTLISVRDELSKLGRSWYTFGSTEMCQYLKAFLEDRIKKGENVGPESPIIVPIWRLGFFKDPYPMTHVSLGDSIKKAFLRAGYTWRPNVLRRWCQTQLSIAVNRRLTSQAFAEHWVGHTGDSSHRYVLHKGATDSLIEEMRESYRKCEELLTTTNTQTIPSDTIRDEVRQELLRMMDVPEVEIERYLALPDQVFKEWIRNNYNAKPKVKQVLVSLDELPKYLEEGAVFVEKIGSDKVIVEI